jgi:hypothetical protein
MFDFGFRNSKASVSKIKNSEIEHPKSEIIFILPDIS